VTAADRVELERTWPATADHIGSARSAVTAYARRAGVPSASIQSIRLAVSEACSNAVVHGYRSEVRDTFTVKARTVPDGIEIIVRDRGCGMRPRPDSPGAGLGLPIISQLAETLEVRTPRDGVGTELCMRFPRAT
jgi:serine/threonine-protein kinase RsbW/stage II sporulation protein AB (anti-sigma F factor)